MENKRKESRIFLSYTRQDSAKVKALYRQLKDAGYHPWMDIEDILPCEDWQKVTMNAIRDAKFFLACLSPRSIDHHGDVQEEIKEALEWRKKSATDNYLIPIRFEDCDVPEENEIRDFHWIDLYKRNGFRKLTDAIHKGMDRLGIFQKLSLRSKVQMLSKDEVGDMLQKFAFYDRYENPKGHGIKHQYEIVDADGEKPVIDHTTGLYWQKGGSPDTMILAQAETYIKKINKEKYSGYDDWRLPTLEEAMSLIEPKNNRDRVLYIDPVFDKNQSWIWTGDKTPAGYGWGVGFYTGGCYGLYVEDVGCVRAVRS